MRLYPVYSWMGFDHASPGLHVRAGLLERPRRASKRLPPDFELAVIDGRLTRALQAELMTYYQGRQTNQRVLQAMSQTLTHPTVIPPHATAGLGPRPSPGGAQYLPRTDSTHSRPNRRRPGLTPDSPGHGRKTCAAYVQRALGRRHGGHEHLNGGTVLRDQWWDTRRARAAVYGEAT